MFHSPSLTRSLLHRLRTTAQCLWLYVAPHSTLEGRRYTFKLSRDPQFPEVPTAPGFPLQPSCITTRSSAIVCGTGYALSIRPLGRTGYRLSLDNRSPCHFLHGAVSASPNALPRRWRLIGSKEGVSPSSAHRSRTSPIRGIRLQRLLDTWLATRYLPGWRPGMSFRTMCILQSAVCAMSS